MEIWKKKSLYRYLINFVHCNSQVLSLEKQNEVNKKHRFEYVQYNIYYLIKCTGNFNVRQYHIETYLEFYQFDKISKLKVHMYCTVYIDRRVFELIDSRIQVFASIADSVIYNNNLMG